MSTLDPVKEEALQFLRDNATAVVASVEGGKPFAATVYYVVDDDFNFFFVTKVSAKKYLNLSYNSNVAIVVGTGPKPITVQARGTADFVFDKDKEKILEQLKSLKAREQVKHLPINEVANLKKAADVVFKVIPSELTFMNLSDEKYPKSISNEQQKLI